jgi:hypothetical protein
MHKRRAVDANDEKLQKYQKTSANAKIDYLMEAAVKIEMNQNLMYLFDTVTQFIEYSKERDALFGLDFISLNHCMYNVNVEIKIHNSICDEIRPMVITIISNYLPNYHVYLLNKYVKFNLKINLRSNFHYFSDEPVTLSAVEFCNKNFKLHRLREHNKNIVYQNHKFFMAIKKYENSIKTCKDCDKFYINDSNIFDSSNFYKRNYNIPICELSSAVIGCAECGYDNIKKYHVLKDTHSLSISLTLL